MARLKRRGFLLLALLFLLLSACTGHEGLVSPAQTPSAGEGAEGIHAHFVVASSPWDSLASDSLQRLIAAFVQQGKIAQALDVSAALLVRLRMQGDTLAVSTLDLEVAELFERISAYGLAAVYYSRSLALMARQQAWDDALRAQVISRAAQAYLHANILDSALVYVDQLERMSREGTELYPMVLATALRAQMCMARGEWRQADSLIEKSLALEAYIPSPIAHRQILLLSARNHALQGRVAPLEALIREIELTVAQGCPGVDSVRYALLMAYFEYLTDHSQFALDHAHRALMTARRLGDARMALEVLDFKKQLFRRGNRLDSLAQCVAESVDLLDSVNEELTSLDFLFADQRAYQAQVAFEEHMWEKMQAADLAAKSNRRTLIVVLLTMVMLFFLTLTSSLVHRHRRMETQNALLQQNEQKSKETNLALASTIQRIVEAQDENLRIGEELKISQERIEQQAALLLNSLEYAYTLQGAILPQWRPDLLHFLEFFRILRPREVVTADLLFLEQVGDYMFCALVDNAQRGVAGASLTFIVYMVLMQLLAERGLTDPGEILVAFSQEMRRQLDSAGPEFLRTINTNMGILAIQKQARVARYALINQTLYYHQGSSGVTTLEGETVAGGILGSGAINPTVGTVDLDEVTTFFLCSSGLFVQPNAEGELLGTQDLAEYIAEVSTAPFMRQKQLLLNRLAAHRRGMEPVDDISIMALRVKPAWLSQSIIPFGEAVS